MSENNKTIEFSTDMCCKNCVHCEHVKNHLECVDGNWLVRLLNGVVVVPPYAHCRNFQRAHTR